MVRSDYLTNDEFFINSVNFMQKEAWKNSENHGWDEAIENPASALMMITREVSELAEEERRAELARVEARVLVELAPER